MDRRSNIVLGEITSYLSSSNVVSADRVALLILSKCTNESIANIRLEKFLVTQENYEKSWSLAKKLVEDHIPVQYLLGEASFRYLDLYVDDRVLIPRPESEMLVDIVKFFIEQNDIKNPLIADIGTGSGNLAISFAHEIESCEVVASDISAGAIEVAQRNAKKYGVEKKISFLECDCLAEFKYFQHSRNHFDCIVSNPPYIPTSVCKKLDRSIKDREPTVALDGGEDGLDVFRKILRKCRWMVREGGLFAFELHETTLDASASIAEKAGLSKVSIISDLAGKERFLVALG